MSAEAQSTLSKTDRIIYREHSEQRLAGPRNETDTETYFTLKRRMETRSLHFRDKRHRTGIERPKIDLLYS